MRVRRQKQSKKTMTLYSQSFGFRTPYQVLVDADFIQAALDTKIDIRDQIPKLLMDASKQMVTPCTMAHLKSRGDEGFGAFLASKRFEKRRCKHQEAVDESQCLSEIIGDENSHNYCVGTQSKQLRSRFRQVPGVPLMYINRSVLILEPPSEVSTMAAKNKEAAKTHASVKELQLLKAVKVKKNGQVEVDKEVAKKYEQQKLAKKEKQQLAKAKLLKKKKGHKEPNPLSIKKKKKEADTTKSATSITANATSAAPSSSSSFSKSSSAPSTTTATPSAETTIPSEGKKKRKRPSKSTSNKTAKTDKNTSSAAMDEE